MTYTSHDIEGFGEKTIAEVAEYYGEHVDHAEYPDFIGWLWDMERSAVLYRHEQ